MTEETMMEEESMQPQQPQRIDKLAAALAKAQGEFQVVPKSGRNPHLNNVYATLDDIINTVRGPLATHGLAFTQLLGSNGGFTLRTILMHESGQYLESTTHISAGAGNRGVNELQALGSAITYMKRYALGAMLGVSTDGDTDGEGPKAKKEQQAQRQARPAPTAKAGSGKSASEGTKPGAQAGPTITAPGKLLEAVNAKTNGHYNSLPHLLNAAKQVLGADWKWPTADDAGGYAEALAVLVDHANAGK